MATEVLSAQESIQSIIVSSYPHMKEMNQKKQYKDLYQKGFNLIENESAGTVQSMAEFAKNLALRS